MEKYRDEPGNTISITPPGTESRAADAKTLHGAFHKSPLPTCLVRCDGKIYGHNTALIKLTGYTREEVEEKSDIRSFLRLLLRDDGEYRKTMEKIEEVTGGKREVNSFQVPLTRKNGEVRHFQCIVYRIFEGKGGKCMVAVIGVDTTEFKWSIDYLREIEERYSALFYRSLDFVYLHDLEGNFIDANPSALRTFGYKRKEMRNLNLKSILAPEYIPQVTETLGEIIRNGTQKELIQYEIRRKNGETRYVEAYGCLIYNNGEPYAILGIGRDITDRLKAEEVEKRFVRKMGFLARSAMDFVQLSSEDDIYEMIGTRLKEIVGDAVVTVTSFDESTNQLEIRKIVCNDEFMETLTRFLGTHPMETRFPVDDEQKAMMMTGRITNIPEGLHRISFGKISKSACEILESMFNLDKVYGVGFSRKNRVYGATAIITFRHTPPLDEELIETFCSQASVALQRWLAEQALRKSEEQYHTLTENINDIIYSMDVNGVITYVGNQVTRYGYTPEEIVSRPYFDFVHPEDREKVIADFEKTIATGEEFPTEFRIVDKNGKIYWVEDNGMIHRDGNGRIEGLTGILRDITWRKETENSLQLSEKKLREQKEALEQKTHALREIIEQIEIEKNKIKEDVMANVYDIILPVLEKIKLTDPANDRITDYTNLLQHLLENITSSFGRKMMDLSHKLTPRELEICAMIKKGLTNKEISRLLNISITTVENHRKSIRKKIDITDRNINLSSYLRHL